MASVTTINDLNDDCLREVFLNIEVDERMKLRGVCKRWCKVVDDCWREVRKVIIIDSLAVDKSSDEFLELFDGYGTLGREFTGTHQTVFIMTSDYKLIEGVMKRCGDVIKKLLDFRKGKDNSSVSLAIKYCSNIEDLTVAIETRKEDKNVGKLLALNKKLRHVSLGIKFPDTKISFRKIPTDYLESFYCYVIHCRDPSSLILTGLKQVVGRCSSSLRNVVVNYFDDELVELIAQKITLEQLELLFEYCDGATPSVLTPILTMKNLRELFLIAADAALPPVTDDFLVALVETLSLLEMIEIERPTHVTNKGFKSLATLKKLGRVMITGCSGITDEFLFLFSGLEELDLKDCRIRDAGVIRLLQEAKSLRQLHLENSLITNETVISADEATKRRANGIRLSLYTTGTATTPMTLTETSLLKIINDDHRGKENDHDDDDNDDY